MHRFGIETEYGFLVEGYGASDQVELARDAVRCAPGLADCWDYSREFPRRDLRGFSVESLQVDPKDWQFERDSKARQSSADTRADRVLPNGARLYNDHGHPEFATRECANLGELVRQDQAGEEFAWSVCQAYAAKIGKRVAVYKNNTDFHGASYGTHENYLVSRSIGFARLAAVLVPMLLARTLLCGAGKVGSESGSATDFQLSARADFFTEFASVDTLFRRPLFNTRDEPHAPESDWVRVHVITGDANMMPSNTARKVGLAQLALDLAATDFVAPEPENPVAAFQLISRGEPFRLIGGKQETAAGLLETYLDAAPPTALTSQCRDLLTRLRDDWQLGAPDVDWAAKKFLVEASDMETLAERRAIDLQYHSLDPDEGLYFGLADSGWVTPWAEDQPQATITRGQVRGYLVEKFPEAIAAVSWSVVRLKSGASIELGIDVDYPAAILETSDVESCINLIEQSHGISR